MPTLYPANTKMYLPGKEIFLMTETYFCNNQWTCNTKYPHKVLILNTSSSHNVLIPDHKYLKLYKYETANTQRWKIDRRTRDFVHYASWWTKWEWICWKSSNMKVLCLYITDNERYTETNWTMAEIRGTINWFCETLSVVKNIILQNNVPCVPLLFLQ
jgi:hypothetical protein